ncbi:ABC transporter ATP-binding protein [Lachnoclostridium phytofermentans]|uniref:ABC transporter related n=1 Tax=Lachnoclostridium phytofermentans (strain ATCC 700394 / DSM 18823 / ISDg) TaxID=357809 RepID=A9KSZ4_LACP7|nr:ABC transporter ATP-binding protein [Lachnoclostridium phytofermentans]ABX42205.1 ABC transporter related [Lachnoclostridium phytofermentans ISDg]
MAMLSLETTNLSKKFGKFTALDGINLKVNEGEVFGYIGPNGAGKTTTIRVLLGILQATEGSAKVFGLDAWKDAVEIHKRIAYVPGDVNLWPNLTGGEVIDLFVSLRGKQDKERREKLLKMFDLDPSKKCRTYSKGNRQKVALVSAFASDADFYILDEPTSGLDPLMEQVFQECVLEQKNKGKGIFLSSHILSEVERLCDRVGIIREGKLVETGTLSELRHLTRVSMNVETANPIDSLESMKGIYGISKQQGGLSFQVDSAEIGNVISHISKFGVKKLESTPPTLEDLFMRHYNANGGK